MGGIGPFVRRNRSGGWKGTERLFSAVGENSIDFPRIPYRLFPDTSVQRLGRHGSNDPFVWEGRKALFSFKGSAEGELRKCVSLR